MRFASLLLAVAALLVTTGQSKAELVYSVGFEQDTYTVTSGQDFSVRVFLYETLTEPIDTSALLTDPLGSAVVTASVSGTGSTTLSSAPTPGTNFFDALLNPPSNLLNVVGLDSGNVINPPDNTITAVELGSFNLTAGIGENTISFADVADFFTVFGAVDVTPNLAAAVPAAGAGIIFTSASITAVPEPSTGLLAVVGILSLSHLRRRRR